MTGSFQNILIPVDLTINSDVAIEKGLELAGEDTVLKLLHVQGTHSRHMIETKMNLLLEEIQTKHPGTSVEYAVEKGPVEDTIEKFAKIWGSDLVIIGKKSNHGWFPFLNTVVPSRLVKKTGIPVLTVKPGSAQSTIRTVVVPVNNEVSKHKLNIISAICNKFNVKIHLVTFMNDDLQPGDENASSLLHTYQWLRSSHLCKVEYAVLGKGNKARSILKYAEQMNADMILLNAETESRIGWWDRHISDVLPPGSKMQVLAIQPA